MSNASKIVLPVVYKIVAEAERQLTHLIGSRVTVKLEINDEKISADEGRHIALQQLVCSEYGVTWSQIAGPLRLRKYVDARAAYCFLAKAFFLESLKSIGQAVCRDHTSVIHLIRRTEGYLKVNDPAIKPILTIKNKFYEDLH